MSKIIKKIAVIVALLITIAVAGVYSAVRISLLPLSGSATIVGISQSISVSYDEWARPHVNAGSLEDALFAQGWLHASHRLWQMETLRRAGKGRLSELLGEDMIKSDEMLWRFGVPQLAKSLEANAEPELLVRVDAYLRGINAGMDRYTLPPPEFLILRHLPKPWTRGDVFALGALMAFQSGNNYENELLRLSLLDSLGGKQFSLFLRDHSDVMDYPFVIPESTGELVSSDANAAQLPFSDEIFSIFRALSTDQNRKMPRLAFGSNAWVVAPAKSATDNALFAFDSHDQLGLPNLFYQVHLRFGPDHAPRSIQGWSVPGLPGVINGFNEHIAWGFTNIGDTQDLFLENRHPQDPTRYKLDGEWYNAKVEQVLIPVRGHQQPNLLEIIHTRSGPLLLDNPPVSVSWTGHRLGDMGLGAILDINLAKDWTEFTAALDNFPAPALNASYADTDGNIGFRTAGLLPRRGQGNGLFPLRGDIGTNHWQGLVPAEDMPELLNPGNHYIGVANARVHKKEPLVSADNAAPYRVKRLQDLLNKVQAIDPDWMRDQQLDWHDTQAELLLPIMLESLDLPLLTEEATEAAGELISWQFNPIASPDNAAEAIFQQWYLELARAIFSEVIGAQSYEQLMRGNYLLNQALDNLILDLSVRGWWPEQREVVFSQTLNTAVEQLSLTLSEQISEWRLGDIQSVRLGHSLGDELPILGDWFSCGEAPWGGGPATLGRASYPYARPFKIGHAATVRVVAELSDKPDVAAVIPGGQSGHPMSPHYCDQFDYWLAGELLPVKPPTDNRVHQFHLAPN